MKKTWHLRGTCATPHAKPSGNHAVQNTRERASHHLLYAAEKCKASEIRELSVARDRKASENPRMYMNLKAR